ncbi:MAG: diphthine--ammonia ligase [Candidatus Omnitrophota bacterium]|nr:diphthine--ammonia ligase [Candidatus Omnitrophota bacterium]
MKAVGLWSGGKDSCFACYKAKSQGFEVVSLINFTDYSGKGSLSHGLSADIIQRQSRLIGIPFLQKSMPKEGYRDAFLALIQEYKTKDGIEGIVFGDIYLQEHRDWIDKVCAELKVKAILPIWTKDTKGLIKEIIDSGFKTIVVSVKKGILGKEWLGRRIDYEFIKDLEKIGDIDLCGENGEYHTFVYDGPIFKKPVEFTTGEKVLKDNHWFLNLFSR